MSKRYSKLGPGEGPNYDWENDHTFVKVSARDTNGAYTLMEDNLKASFALGLHRHDNHAETFYFLEGAVDFYVDGDWHRCGPGTTMHVPPEVPHACRVADGAPARMLMIFQPSGFDGFLAELSTMTNADFADEAKMAALNARYDIIPMGPVPSHPDDQA
ncbi:cupin domain-containing protein [Ruegeria arenilitoris]|uniref:cupin domain-containing protein n=1 Tax=Ruegeria arenilitoris TaxID=1173585 RepID=UPI00147C186D|nr:cupin domain-containing protein [Ruegeria arenilitoris]